MKEEIENGELLFIKVIGNLKAKSKISVKIAKSHKMKNKDSYNRIKCLH